jgi:hypothetical protein
MRGEGVGFLRDETELAIGVLAEFLGGGDVPERDELQCEHRLGVEYCRHIVVNAYGRQVSATMLNARFKTARDTVDGLPRASGSTTCATTTRACSSLPDWT